MRCNHCGEDLYVYYSRNILNNNLHLKVKCSNCNFIKEDTIENCMLDDIAIRKDLEHWTKDDRIFSH